VPLLHTLELYLADDDLFRGLSFPELRFIWLCGQRVTVTDLWAVLRNCPRLQGLDVSRCPYIYIHIPPSPSMPITQVLPSPALKASWPRRQARPSSSSAAPTGVLQVAQPVAPSGSGLVSPARVAAMAGRLFGRVSTLFVPPFSDSPGSSPCVSPTSPPGL